MFASALQPLVDLLLGVVPAPGPPSDISFTAPAQGREIANIPSLNEVAIALPNPRKGCVIGWRDPSRLTDLSRRIPFVGNDGRTKPLEIGELKAHTYGGPTNITEISVDKIGHIYTKYGGLIDIGHVRDHADIARYIATNVVKEFRNGGDILLGDDTDQFRGSTGQRMVHIKRQGKDPSAYQAAVLGAVISYEVAVWHEISTYKTWQDYSTFSAEDNYSNLFGAYIGFLACLTEGLEYNVAVTAGLYRRLLTLIPQSQKVTEEAVNFLEGKWYEYGLDASYEPDAFLVLKKRHMATGYNESRVERISPSYFVGPWLITDIRALLPEVCREALITNPPSNFQIGIKIPTTDENDKPLRDFYSFEIVNPANGDSSIFDHPDLEDGVDSSKFGIIVEQIRKKLLVRDLNIDKPQ